MKKGVILASIFALITFLNFEDIQARFSKKILGAELLPMDTLVAMCAERVDAYMDPEIELAGGRLAYDSAQNMLLIPQDVDAENFEGILSVPEGKLYFAEDEMLRQKKTATQENRIFRLFWIKDDQGWMYNVYFTGMPVMQIMSESEDGLGNVYGELALHNPYKSTEAYQSTSASWHLRGATTLSYDKKSYRVTTGEKVSLLGMRSDEDWILHALYDDEGLLHNKLSYEVWQEIAATNQVPYDEGINFEFVELFLDNDYMGVYGLSERIDRKALNLNEKDILYKSVGVTPLGEDDFYTVLTEDMEPVFTLKYPKEFDAQDWQPLKQWTDRYYNGDPGDYEGGKALLNMENAVDYTLFNLLISGMDNTKKNIYWWADYQSDGSYQIIKIPWDLNMTWGNSWIDDYNCNFNKYQEKNINASYGWTNDMETLYEQNPEEIGALLADRWQELRKKTITKENLNEKATNIIEYLHESGAYIRNQQAWPPKAETWSDAYIYDFIDRHIDYLDEYFSQMAAGG